MAITIKKLTLWTGEIANRPGALAAVLEPLASVGVDLGVAMAYEKPGDHARSVVEIAPLSSARAKRAADEAGLSPSTIPCLVVDADDRPGLGHAMTSALGNAGINLHFTVALVVGKKSRVVFGFGDQVDLNAAARAIRSGAGSAGRRPIAAARPRAVKKVGARQPRRR